MLFGKEKHFQNRDRIREHWGWIWRCFLILECPEGHSQTEQDSDVYLKPDDFVDLPPGFDFQDRWHRLFELLNS
jgi:hypothetical protein